MRLQEISRGNGCWSWVGASIYLAFWKPAEDVKGDKLATFQSKAVKQTAL